MQNFQVNLFFRVFVFLTIGVSVSTVRGGEQEGNSPNLPKKVETKSKIALFNGKNLDGWYPFIRDRGKNTDPKGVFTVRDRLLRVSGEEYGCITTNDEFENYIIEVEFKMGEKMHAPRIGKAFDSGLLIHSQGEDGVYGGSWMRSLECNIINGGVGDFIVVVPEEDRENFALTATVRSETPAPSGGWDFDPEGKPKTLYKGRINRIGRDPDWKDIAKFRGKNEIENPHGQWNVMKCVVKDGTIEVFLNERFVNRATDVRPRKGRIQIQSEGAEFFFRRIDLFPL